MRGEKKGWTTRQKRMTGREKNTESKRRELKRRGENMMVQRVDKLDFEQRPKKEMCHPRAACSRAC